MFLKKYSYPLMAFALVGMETNAMEVAVKVNNVFAQDTQLSELCATLDNVKELISSLEPWGRAHDYEENDSAIVRLIAVLSRSYNLIELSKTNKIQAYKRLIDFCQFAHTWAADKDKEERYRFFLSSSEAEIVAAFKLSYGEPFTLKNHGSLSAISQKVAAILPFIKASANFNEGKTLEMRSDHPYEQSTVDLFALLLSAFYYDYVDFVAFMPQIGFKKDFNAFEFLNYKGDLSETIDFLKDIITHAMTEEVDLLELFSLAHKWDLRTICHALFEVIAQLEPAEFARFAREVPLEYLPLLVAKPCVKERAGYNAYVKAVWELLYIRYKYEEDKKMLIGVSGVNEFYRHCDVIFDCVRKMGQAHCTVLANGERQRIPLISDHIWVWIVMHIGLYPPVKA